MAIATPNTIAGYDYEFVDTPHDRVICKICYLPTRDPYLSVCCGHLFCKSCLDNVKKATAFTNDCPVCRDEEFVTFRNKAIDREVRGLHIYCTNKEKGCKWQGELNDINNHLGNSDGCKFEPLKCSNECGKMIERRYLTIHVETECPRRKVNCQYCHDTGEHQFIEGQHKEECPKLPLPCLNKCEVGSVPREDMEAHRKECPLEMIQCEYHNVGCEVRMTRKDQEEHDNEKMKEHLMKTKLVMTATKHELNDTKATLANTESKLTDTNNQLASALQRISTLEVLLYQTTDKAVFRPIKSSAEWSVKLVAMTVMSKSGDQECPVILKMSQYHNSKDNYVIWYSDSFYTHNKGYKMCLRIDAAGNGDGRGTHLSVYLFLMKGPHDDELTWPLWGKFEIKLLNQIIDREHRSMSVNYHYTDSREIDGDRAARGLGTSQFISNKDLHKTTPTCQYLKDDCLFFQVTKL